MFGKPKVEEATFIQAIPRRSLKKITIHIPWENKTEVYQETTIADMNKTHEQTRISIKDNRVSITTYYYFEKRELFGYEKTKVFNGTFSYILEDLETK